MPFRRDARGCEVTRAQGWGSGVRPPVLAWPLAREGLATFFLLSEPQLCQLESEVCKDLTHLRFRVVWPLMLYWAR